ncbi:Conserved_hypothetical protein [Hexamita inflata]|uniref:DUF659 domain-containing protein n=1 Tax=Hexamita inflata TaxID=28002 RepID=A0AA86NEM6_9EUKA|nr:Conserved hypothetical protein [Hexamita inflata]
MSNFKFFLENGNKKMFKHCFQSVFTTTLAPNLIDNQSINSFKGIKFMLQTEQKTHFLEIEYTSERQDDFWLASKMKEIIEDLENNNFNIFVVAIACDSASCGIKAHQLLNGLVKNQEFDQIRNTQLVSSIHPVLLSCAAHVGNLFLQDY